MDRRPHASAERDGLDPPPRSSLGRMVRRLCDEAHRYLSFLTRGHCYISWERGEGVFAAHLESLTGAQRSSRATSSTGTRCVRATGQADAAGHERRELDVAQRKPVLPPSPAALRTCADVAVLPRLLADRLRQEARSVRQAHPPLRARAGRHTRQGARVFVNGLG